MITAAQLRAGRGLLDWTRADLAKAAGVSPETIKNIEHGTFRPQESTADSIVKAFALHDVEFTENEGVRKSSQLVTHYEGTTAFRKYVDDFYQVVLQNPNDRNVCIFGNRDDDFVNVLGDYAGIHLKRMSALDNLKFRALMTQSDDVTITDYIEYRRLPNIAFAIPFSVCNDRFDFIVYGEGDGFPKVVSVKSRIVADAYRAQFDAMWDLSEPIKAGSK